MLRQSLYSVSHGTLQTLTQAGPFGSLLLAALPR